MTTTPVLWTSLEAAVITGGRNTREWNAFGVCLNAADIKPGDLFFAAPTDDLHQVFLKGAAAAVVPMNTAEMEGWPLLKVPDVFEALRGLARVARFKTHAQVIAVQGRASRHFIGETLKNIFDVYMGGRHFSQGLAAMPENADFAVLGFSPQVRPDIAIVTDCTNVDASVFETMSPSGRILINADSQNAPAAIALARASGIRNVFTYGRSAGSDALLLDALQAANGVRVRMRILSEAVETILPAGREASMELLAAILVFKLSARIATLFANEKKQVADHSNLSLMDNLFKGPAQAAFRVVNMIDLGQGHRTLVLDNIAGMAEKTPFISNKDLDIPLKIDNLKLVYACRGLSLLPDAEGAIRDAKPSARVENIVTDVLAPGDFLTFKGVAAKGLMDKPKNLIHGALRLIPSGRKVLRTDHAV
jgi:hypothetical protein